MFYLSKFLFKDNIYKNNYFYFILLCRVLVVSLSYPYPGFFKFAHVPVSSRVIFS